MAAASSSSSSSTVRTFDININVRPSTQFFDEEAGPSSVAAYKSHSINRGAVIIMNNIVYENPKIRKRTGSEKDNELLHELFSQMGLLAEQHVNLTAEQMRDTLTNFLTSSKVHGIDMIFVIVMGHGYESTQGSTNGIYGIDGIFVNTAWVEEQVYNNPIFQTVPKMFLYQTCCEKIQTYRPAIKRYRHKQVRDIIVVHSVFQMEAKDCNNAIGSVYIKCLCQTLMEHAHDDHFENLLKRTNQLLISMTSDNKTSFFHEANYINRGFKNLYLHPKIYLKDGKIENLPPRK